MNKTGLDWIKLNKLGCDWIKLNKLGCDWIGLDRIKEDWIRLDRIRVIKTEEDKFELGNWIRNSLQCCCSVGCQSQCAGP